MSSSRSKTQSDGNFGEVSILIPRSRVRDISILACLEREPVVSAAQAENKEIFESHGLFRVLLGIRVNPRESVAGIDY